MNQQQEQTQTQRHLTILSAIDELSTITAATDEGKKKIISLYESYKNIISRFIQEKGQLDDSAKTLYDRLSSSGVESLSGQDLDSLRRLMFSALVIEEGKLFQTKEKAEVSRPDLVFGETLNAINKERDRAKRERQTKNREFIEQLVLRYGSALRLSPKEQESLKQTLLQQETILQRIYGDRVIPENAYIQEAQKAIQQLKPQAAFVQPILRANKKAQSLYEKTIGLYQQQRTLSFKQPDYSSYQQSLETLGAAIAQSYAQQTGSPLEAIQQQLSSLYQRPEGTPPPSPQEFLQQATEQLREIQKTQQLNEFLQEPTISSAYQEATQTYQEAITAKPYQASLQELGNEILATLTSSNISQEKIEQLRSTVHQIQIQENGIILSPDEYIEKVETILSQQQSIELPESSFIDFLKEVYQQSPHIQSIHQQAELLYREERAYEILEKEIIRQEKDFAIRSDLREIYPPFVALEAAVYALLKTSPPKIPPEEIVENAIALGNAFTAYSDSKYPETPEEIAYLIQESISARYGDIAKKQSIEILDQIIGPASSISEESKKALLYEFIRSDIQGDLLRIIEDKSLLKEIFTTGNNGMTVEAFERFLESPLFAFIEQSIKRQAGQKQGGAVGSLLQIVSSSKKIVETTPKTNVALLFIFNARNLDEIQKNEPLYARLLEVFRELSEDKTIPKSPKEAFFALLLASIEPREQHSFFETVKKLLQEDNHRRNYRFEFLHVVMESLKEKALHQLVLLFRPYVSHVVQFGKQKVVYFLRRKIFSSFSSQISKVVAKKISGAVLTKIGTKLGASLLGGPVGTIITVALTAFDVIKSSLSFFLQDVPIVGDAVKNLDAKKIILSVVIFVFIPFLLLFLLPQNPVLIQQKTMPFYLEMFTLKDPSVYVKPIDCEKDPTNPVCLLCYDEKGQRDPEKCQWPVMNGCITQGPHSGHKTERNGQGIDIGRVPKGAPVRAMFPGEIIETRWFFYDGQKTKNPNYGNMVRIRTLTNPPFTIVYAHLRQTPHIVKQGDIIGPETIIGYVDDTGYGTGTHLHMEIQGVPAGNILPFNVPPCINRADCERKMAQMGYSNCW